MALITVGEVLDATIDHYKKHAKELLGISLFLVLASMPNAVAQVISPPVSDTTWSTLAIVTFALQVIGTIVTIAVSIWIHISLILAIKEQQVSKGVIDPMKIGKAAQPFFWRVLLTTIITVVITLTTSLLWIPGLGLIFLAALEKTPAVTSIIGVALLCIGAIASLLATIYASVTLSFSSFFAVLGNKKAFEAIKASYSLVKGRFFATLLRSVLPKFIFSLALFIISLMMLVAATIMSIAFSVSAPLLRISSGGWLLINVALGAIFAPIPIIIDYYVFTSLKNN